jgi:integrase
MSSKVNPFKEQNETIARSLTASPSEPLNNADDVAISQLLQLSEQSRMLSTAARAKIIVDFSEKEEKVANACNLSKIKVRSDDGRIYLIIKRKPITSNCYVGLIDKLYDYFFGLKQTTLETFFPDWQKWRDEETSVSKKTIKENYFLWNALLKEDDITKVPLKDIKVQDYITYFRRITKDRQLTRKRFNDLKSIMNSMLYLCIERGIIEHNCLQDINYRQFAFKSENAVIKPYTEEERLLIINHLDDEDFYSLAIKLDFHLVLRIGELKGLKWSDIYGDYIRIQRFVDNDNQIVEDIKGHAKEGKRLMPLTPTAKEILDIVRQMNPDSDYIFIRNGQPLSTCTFNRHLKKCCEELGIEYRSSHKLRFSTASIMYKNGVKDTELQKLLGHSTLSMSHHYLKSITEMDSTAEKMKAILG